MEHELLVASRDAVGILEQPHGFFDDIPSEVRSRNEVALAPPLTGGALKERT